MFSPSHPANCSQRDKVNLQVKQKTCLMAQNCCEDILSICSENQERYRKDRDGKAFSEQGSFQKSCNIMASPIIHYLFYAEEA